METVENPVDEVADRGGGQPLLRQTIEHSQEESERGEGGEEDLSGTGCVARDLGFFGREWKLVQGRGRRNDEELQKIDGADEHQLQNIERKGEWILRGEEEREE